MARRVSAMLAALVFVAGCSLLPGHDDAPSGPSTPPSTSWRAVDRDDVRDGGRLTLATDAMPSNFNPQHVDGAGTEVAELLAPTTGSAVRLTADGGWKVDPDYAESVTLSDTDPQTVSVRLNPRAIWSDGTAITADDMIAFWKAQNGSDDAFEVASTAGWDDIADVREGSDEFSYVVEFDKPIAEWPLLVYPRLPDEVTSDPASFNEGFTERPSPSSGPFVIDEVDREGGMISQVPNPRWWGDDPKLDRIVWRVAAPQVAAKAYRAGELDAVRLDAETYVVAGDRGDIRRAAGLEWSHVTMNAAGGPLADQKLRRAVALALDRQAIADAVARDVGALGVVQDSMIYVPGQRGYTPTGAKAIAHDPAKTRELLADAGYGGDKPLTLRMPVPDDTPSNLERAKLVRDQLAEVGIVVKLESVAPGDFFASRVIPLDFDLVTFTWTGSAFPIEMSRPRFNPADSPQNFTGLDDDKLGKLWNTATATLTGSAQADAVRAVDERLFERVPIVPLAMLPEVMAVDDDVVNYGVSQFEAPDFTVVGFRG